MAISWLSALKVVPWDKVMEHAPGVLDKARGLIDKHRGASTQVASPADPDPAQELPSLGELKNRCLALQMQLEAQASATTHGADLGRHGRATSGNDRHGQAFAVAVEVGDCGFGFSGDGVCGFVNAEVKLRLPIWR